MRIPRPRFTVRRMMAAVLVIALLSSAYVGLLRYKPVLVNALSNQVIVTNGARAAYHNAVLTREVTELSLQEALKPPALDDRHVERERFVRQFSRGKNQIWLPYSKRVLAEGESSIPEALRTEIKRARDDEHAKKSSYERERSTEQGLAKLVKAVGFITPESIR